MYDCISLLNVEVQVGLAKGIGAPVGSVIVGSKAFIHKVMMDTISSNMF